MLKHHNSEATPPERVVIIGARGFLGKHTQDHLVSQGIDSLGLTSADVDLLSDQAADRLADSLRPGDAVVVFAALTPDKGKGIDTMMKNLRIAETVCMALQKRPCAHVIYISSDAVYPMDETLVRESSCAAPGDLYGTMHKAREVMFQSTAGESLAILRPTLVYGHDDTHNSYGPNRFRRLAASEGRITLGGAGEETRDHIYVDDVAKLVGLALQYRSSGLLNLATGRSVTFFDLAQLVARQFDRDIEVVCTERKAPITHRAFDVTALLQSFPKFVFTPLEQGLEATHQRALDA